MSEINITLAVEDVLSEALARKILRQANRNYVVTQCLCRGGSGYLRSKIRNFNRAAHGLNFFVLTDQDRPDICAPELINEWLGCDRNPNLIFRVAVMEVESWLLAHREALSSFLSVAGSRIPHDTDSLNNPKQYLINIARKSRIKSLRDAIVPPVGSTSTQGPDYNSRLSDFVDSYWDARVARGHSNSLDRAWNRLLEFKRI